VVLSAGEKEKLPVTELVWALGSLCTLHRLPFSADLLTKQFPPPYREDTLVQAVRALGFKAKYKAIAAAQLHRQVFPCVALLKSGEHEPACEQATAQTDAEPGEGHKDQASDAPPRLVLITQADAGKVVYFEPGRQAPVIRSTAQFDVQYAGRLLLAAPKVKAIADPGAPDRRGRAFGFGWFIPELLKHKKVWRDVLLASLVLQLLALGTPLFTQTVIDKVVVHRTESTLIAIAIGMGTFMSFGALLTWVRQYLVLHTGNRVDAVLGAAVFDHLFALPLRYFQNRPTGVIAARLHGVETIREFIASAAVSLILDFPFLLICVAVMFTYSAKLTVLTLGILLLIAALCAAAAPIFQVRLQEQFLLGARNQAFLTEYIAGMETVKSLQMEPQLKAKYSDYLATYLHAGFQTKQVGNTYNVIANLLEQGLSLLILVVGAYTVMGDGTFTIGMLVAFQMFSGKLSQPMLRMVGLWQQFQQARLSIDRLGDLMNVPAEPYSLTPSREAGGVGSIEFEAVSFRYSDEHPYLYKSFSLTVRQGATIAIMGPSGSGKSTLTKLLQGFYPVSDGQIRLDGTDIRHLSANELRNYFGVVPQETTLFSGTIYDNLIMSNPHATFAHVVKACKMAEIHEVIERLPQGYNTEIGERGAGLSGGQKQRIAIARALLKAPKILIFDEATSNLDSATSEHFAKTINALKGQVTMLFITHALPRTLQVDDVVRIGSGTAASMHMPRDATRTADAGAVPA
jgi:subfamily B ATP-binding cassette protein HlyB/CyaB